MCRCYRDTKMEMQGLSEAPNNISQHGALRGDTLSTLATTFTSRTAFTSAKTEVDGPRELCSDNNNNTRPKTVPFRLQAENGGAVYCSAQSKLRQTDTNSFTDKRQANVSPKKQLGVLSDFQTSAHNAGSSRDSGARSERKMALLEREEEGGQEAPELRPQPLPSALSSSGCQQAQRLYVLLSVPQLEGTTEPTPGAGLFSTLVGKQSTSANTEHYSNNLFRESNDDLNAPDNKALRKDEHSFCISTDEFNSRRTDYHNTTAEDAVFSNKYDDSLAGESCKDSTDSKLSRVDLDESSALVSVTSGLMETIDSQDLIPDSDDPQLTMSSGEAPANETFSGTIMINNQSIIVTIDNGVLTLSTPPEGYVHKDDDIHSLKEHLGMKDHEDFVLLNYDGGTKTIGKINTLTVPSCDQLKDSDLSLVEDCSVEDSFLDCCSILKHEVGTVYTLTEADLVTPSPKAAVPNEEVQAPIKSKKEMVVLFACPENGCYKEFESRQKLKVHLLNHAEDPRPFQCTVEGCGWAFATSYKLKRHLQSHDKQRPHVCQIEGCGRRFTTVYNLKAHVKIHEQDNAFACDICSERFRSATRLASHQRVHFEPQRPHKCEFPGCEKTFLTFSALFSHNRTHFRETGHFSCHYPGCDKTYDKACRLKIHLRSHTGERPFVCDSGGCGGSFTSMSKLLRHKRKHEDDRRFVCPEEGCGKSFTRAEHLKGHSITHLGTKPFQCHAEGCNAKFSARSSLYIHSKKHKQDASSLRTRCPVANCTKHFSSRSSLKSHMLKCHHISPDVLSHMEMTPSLTPSSELVSPSPALVTGAAGDQLTNLDLSSLLSGVSGGSVPTGGVGSVPTAGVGVGMTVGGTTPSGMFTMDLSLVSSGILTIDPSSGGATLSAANTTSLAKPTDPLLLTAGVEVESHEALERSVGEVLPPQGTLNLDDVQSVTPEALGSLSALSIQGAGVSVDPLSGAPVVDTLSGAPVVELLASPSKGSEVSSSGAGPLLSCVEVMETQEGEKVLTQFVFPGPSSSLSPHKDPDHTSVSPGGFLETGGSARTDYRAIQMAKKRKQKGPATALRRAKVLKASAAPLVLSGVHYNESSSSTRATPQYVHVQLLQDDPASDGELAFQLSSQPSSSHSQLTVDLPVNILQETSGLTEDDAGSENCQFTGSTINLQDLE